MKFYGHESFSLKIILFLFFHLNYKFIKKLVFTKKKLSENLFLIKKWSILKYNFKVLIKKNEKNHNVKVKPVSFCWIEYGGSTSKQIK